jgi:hypothetical protein
MFFEMRSISYLLVFGSLALAGTEDLFCGQHEEFHLCGNHCDLKEKTCKISLLNLDLCRPGCVCEEGYYRAHKTKVCEVLTEKLTSKFLFFSLISSFICE